MKLKYFIITILLIIFNLSQAYAQGNCFVAKEEGKIIKEIGDCRTRHSPCSTFKVTLALMGFDSGVLKTTDSPEVPFTSEIEKGDFASYYNPKKYPVMLFYPRNHTPESWMKYSVIWYSQYITKQLGMEKIREYVNKFNYGNMDLSGIKGNHDGLVWIYSSLQISGLEQVDFIEKLVNKQLPVSKVAHENTINIIKLETIYDSWQLYGKTGGGMDNGWFIGFIDNGKRKIAFAQYVEQPKGTLLASGRVAKEVTKENLISVVLDK